MYIAKKTVLEKQILATQRKAERKAKNTQLAVDKLASQVNKNPPYTVQKIASITDF